MGKGNLIKLDVNKRRQILLWVFQKRPDLDDYGLGDFLYFLDFDWYEKTKKYLTGTTYKKRKQKMKIPAFYPGKPNLECLSEEEKEFIEQTFKRFSKKSCEEIIEMSRMDIPYLTTDYNKSLPYKKVFSRTKNNRTRTEKKPPKQK